MESDVSVLLDCEAALLCISFPTFRNSLFFSLCPLETAGNEIPRDAAPDPGRTDTAARTLKRGYSSECLEMLFRSACLQMQLVDCHNHLKAEETSTRRKLVSLIRDIMNAGLINILISDAFTQIEFSIPVSAHEKQGT